MATARRFLGEGEAALRCRARALALDGDAVTTDASCFHPGGGGQPCDLGWLVAEDGARHRVTEAWSDDAGAVWHRLLPPPAFGVGATLRLAVDEQRRLALARHHTVLHLLNSVVLREHGGWITGARIEPDYARIDFRLERVDATLCERLERAVNAVIERDLPVRAFEMEEAEFRARDDLRRTLNVEPPAHDGRVRVVEIVGFDAQACGGTHVPSLAALGRLSIYRAENKGRINKRLYVRLGPAGGGGPLTA